MCNYTLKTFSNTSLVKLSCNQQEAPASARNVSAWSTKPMSVKYFATSATDQLEASGGSSVNVDDNFGSVTTASLFDGGDLLYTRIQHCKETTTIL